MKSTLLVLTVCMLSFFSEAQTQIIKDSLSVSALINLGESIDFEDYKVKFKTVITDSRCPKNIMCVRAGEANVLVSIYKNGRFIEDKKIRIDASGYVMETNNLAFKADDFKIYGFDLSPYPTSVGDIDDKAYQLEIVFKPKRLD